MKDIMKLKLIIIALCVGAIGLVPVNGQGETIANLAAKECSSCGGDGIRTCFSCKGAGKSSNGKSACTICKGAGKKKCKPCKGTGQQ